MAEEQTSPRPRRAARARPQQKQPSPTRVIEPGALHYRIAQELLEGAQRKAAHAGVRLDVGEFPETALNAGGDDPQKLVRIVAHGVARVSDRFSFLRKLSRHAEGQEKRAGLVSDVIAAAVTLYERNPELIKQLGTNFAQDLQQRRAAAAEQKAAEQAVKQAQTQPQNGVTHNV